MPTVNSPQILTGDLQLANNFLTLLNQHWSQKEDRMLTAIGNCFTHIRDRMDHTMVRLYRNNLSVRKTIAIAALTFLPLAVYTGITLTYFFSLPKDIRPWAAACSIGLPFSVTTIPLWLRYGWVTESKAATPLPKEIEILLTTETENQDLPDDYRKRCEEAIKFTKNFNPQPQVFGEFL